MNVSYSRAASHSHLVHWCPSSPISQIKDCHCLLHRFETFCGQRKSTAISRLASSGRNRGRAKLTAQFSKTQKKASFSHHGKRSTHRISHLQGEHLGKSALEDDSIKRQEFKNTRNLELLVVAAKLDPYFAKIATRRFYYKENAKKSSNNDIRNEKDPWARIRSQSTASC